MNSGGAGGSGGGAVALIATEIRLDAEIKATGAGGFGGSGQTGGGGGGSGGMVVLDAPIMLGMGTVFANGGGGGQGGTGGTRPAIGAPGAESIGPESPGMGGISDTAGGRGGLGSFACCRVDGFKAVGPTDPNGGGGAGVVLLASFARPQIRQRSHRHRASACMPRIAIKLAQSLAASVDVST